MKHTTMVNTKKRVLLYIVAFIVGGLATYILSEKGTSVYKCLYLALIITIIIIIVDIFQNRKRRKAKKV